MKHLVFALLLAHLPIYGATASALSASATVPLRVSKADILKVKAAQKEGIEQVTKLEMMPKELSAIIVGYMGGKYWSFAHVYAAGYRGYYNSAFYLCRNSGHYAQGWGDDEYAHPKYHDIRDYYRKADFSGLGLETLEGLENYVSDCKHLEIMDLSHNDLTLLVEHADKKGSDAAVLCAFWRVKFLHLNHNRINSILPVKVFRGEELVRNDPALAGVTHLDLSHNPGLQLRGIPTSVEVFKADECGIEDLDADAFGWMPHLRICFLNGNRLTEIPNSLLNLAGLHHLHVNNNFLNIAETKVGTCKIHSQTQKIEDKKKSASTSTS